MSTPIPAGTWTLDTVHSSIGFSVRHMMVSKVRGRFTSFNADIVTADNPAESKLSATVDMASVDTGDEGRDQHLRTSDFFDIENHPTMTFTSTGLSGAASDYKLTGDLSIRGVTRPVTFELEVGGIAKDPWGHTRAGFTATTSIDRKDWGLEYNALLETGGVVIGDKVNIDLDIEATLNS